MLNKISMKTGGEGILSEVIQPQQCPKGYAPHAAD